MVYEQGFSDKKYNMVKNVCIDDVVIFRSVENKIQHFFYFNFRDNENVNHCTEENKVFLIHLVKIIMENYESTEILYFSDVCTAVLFAFYLLVLLELNGDVFSIEEICYYMRIQKSAVPKIREIYYGIIWGDNPVLAEIRGRILFPENGPETEPRSDVVSGRFSVESSRWELSTENVCDNNI